MKMRDEGDHLAMLEAGKAWLRIKKSGQRNWADWTVTIGLALVRARSEAMLIAGTNQPKGRGYNETFSVLLNEYRLDDIEQVARRDLFSIMDELTAVNRYRDKKGDPSKLDHPTTVWRQFKTSDEYKAALMARGEYTPPPTKTPPREKPTLLEEAVTLRDQVRDLTGQLEEAIQERDGARDELAQLRQEPQTESLPIDAGAAIERLLDDMVHSTAHNFAGRLVGGYSANSIKELGAWLADVGMHLHELGSAGEPVSMHEAEAKARAKQEAKRPLSWTPAPEDELAGLHWWKADSENGSAFWVGPSFNEPARFTVFHSTDGNYNTAKLVHAGDPLKTLDEAKAYAGEV
jgi:hypothetical protein